MKYIMGVLLLISFINTGLIVKHIYDTNFALNCITDIECEENK
jgi:hypothetical protein